MIVIIDYGMGNLRSVQNKFLKMGIAAVISSDLAEIQAASKLILPGVGHFKTGMNQLKDRGYIELLNQKVFEEQTPILGICLGAQLFCNYSTEGDADGLGWIDASVLRFNVSDYLKYKIPHIGWNSVVVKNKNCLDRTLGSDDMFYFVHSYHIKCNSPDDIWMTSYYDYEFVSAIRKNNIYGTQFHPEKSRTAGFNLLKQFTEL